MFHIKKHPKTLYKSNAQTLKISTYNKVPMKEIHNVRISVFASYTEGVQEVKDALTKFFPNIDINKEEKLVIEEEQAKSDSEHDDDLAILTIYTKKQRYLRDFIQNLAKNLDKDDKKTIIEQADSRSDNKNRFFLRIDKTELIKNNKFKLTEKGNCYHIKMNIATFPNNKENAIKVLREIFG